MFIRHFVKTSYIFSSKAESEKHTGTDRIKVPVVPKDKLENNMIGK
jgi:hypothetical protein